MNKKIAYLPGVWDILHSGHLNIIRRASLLADHLIVGVCSDRLVKIHKGAEAMLPETERAAVVESLKYVNEVCIYDDPDQTKNLKLFCAKIFVIGEDFGKQGVPEHEIALKHCADNDIEVIRIPRKIGISSTEIKDNSKRSNVIKSFWEERSKKAKTGELNSWQATSLTKSPEHAVNRQKQDVKFIVEAINRSLAPKHSVLELGCGTGRISIELSKRYDNVYAIDYMEDFIEVAKKELNECKNIHFRCCKTTEFDKSIDYNCCVIAGVLPYFSNDEIEELVLSLQEIKSIQSIILKESLGTLEKYELPEDHYSEELKTNYTAEYKSLSEIIQAFSKGRFVLKYSEIIAQHREDSHLRIMLFERL
jgi:glycerol-3-phosphate cytidylyltransferase